jgi:hypothetical protein
LVQHGDRISLLLFFIFKIRKVGKKIHIRVWFWLENLKERNSLEDLGVDGSMDIKLTDCHGGVGG